MGPTRAPLARNSGLGLQLQWFTLRAHNGPLTHSEAMSLDLLLTQQLLALAGSAHFGGAAHMHCHTCLIVSLYCFDALCGAAHRFRGWKSIGGGGGGVNEILLQIFQGAVPWECSSVM